MLYKLDDVSFRFFPEKPILDHISMELRKDEFVLLTGHNGSGKTTFCRLLTGLLSHYQGSILFQEQELRTYKAYNIAETVLYLKQEGSLNVVAATADEDLQIRQLMFTNDDGEETLSTRKDALQGIELIEQQNTPTWELSSGQIKRIGLASLSLFKSHFWILDEPCIGLDDRTIDVLKSWLTSHQAQGYGALVIDHTGSLKDIVYQRIYQIMDGKITQL